MKLLITLLLAAGLSAQSTKPNLTDTKPPAVAPPGSTLAIILSPNYGVLAIPESLIDRTTTPWPTLRIPAASGSVAQLWSDEFLFSGSQSFTTLSAPSGSVFVFKNGIKMTISRDYSQTSSAGLVTTTFLGPQPINQGDSVSLMYIKP